MDCKDRNNVPLSLGSTGQHIGDEMANFERNVLPLSPGSNKQNIGEEVDKFERNVPPLSLGSNKQNIGEEVDKFERNVLPLSPGSNKQNIGEEVDKFERNVLPLSPGSKTQNIAEEVDISDKGILAPSLEKDLQNIGGEIDIVGRNILPPSPESNRQLVKDKLDKFDKTVLSSNNGQNTGDEMGQSDRNVLPPSIGNNEQKIEDEKETIHLYIRQPCSGNNEHNFRDNASNRNHLPPSPGCNEHNIGDDAGMTDMPDIKALKRIRKEIVVWVEDTQESIMCLRELADEIEMLFQKTSRAKIGGSAASIAGGVMSVVGFGLSFVTFGSSLILTIVGGAIAGAGGVTTGVASVVNSIKTSSKKKAAEEAIDRYNKQAGKIKRKCIEISDRIRNIDERMPEWVRFWGKLTIHCTSTAVNATWSVVGKSIVTSLKLSSGLAGDAASAGKTVFSVAGTAARGVHIAGGVVGILLLPLDVHTLVDSALDVGKRNVPKSATTIRKVADDMEKGCPTIEEVDQMIERTINRHLNA